MNRARLRISPALLETVLNFPHDVHIESASSFESGGFCMIEFVVHGPGLPPADVQGELRRVTGIVKRIEQPPLEFVEI